MQFLPIFEFVLVLLATIYVLHQYSAKDVPTYVKAVCFISWFLSLAILIIVPLDVFYTVRNGEAAGNHAKDGTFKWMVGTWNVVYWTGFIFTWVVLPLLQEYENAGEFTIKDKIKRSLRVNLIGYAIMAVCGVLFVLYLHQSNRIGKEGIMSFLTTFSNCFGVGLIIICLSYGLVYIPKRCFQQVRQRANLKAHQYQAAMIEERKEKTEFELEDLVKHIDALLARDDVKEEDKQHLRLILALAPEQLVRDVREMVAHSTMSSSDEEEYTRKNIVKLHKRMKKKLNYRRRLEHKWDATIKRAFLLEDLLETNNPSEWRTRMSYIPSIFPSLENHTSALEYVWYQYLVRIIFFFVGLTFTVFSLGVFAAEMLTFTSNAHVFNIERYLDEGGHLITKSQFLCLVPLSYILVCVYAAFFNMRFAGRYGLYRHHQTDSSSLIFASLAFARVSSPLVVNFLQMVKIHGTAFEEVMGNAHFSTSFTSYFPLVLSVLVLFTLFDIYGRILNQLGLKRYKFDEEFTNDKIEEGKQLLDKCRNSKSFNIARQASIKNSRKFSDAATSANSNSPRMQKGSDGYMLGNEVRFSRGSLGSLDAV